MVNLEKFEWQGRIKSIQPRTNVWRYKLDNRTHRHLGYNLFLDGAAKGQQGQFSVAISEKQLMAKGFEIGDLIRGTAWPKKHPEREFADYYRAGALKILEKSGDAKKHAQGPPWVMHPPALAVYEWRGARVLSRSRWQGKCFPCVWANMASVVIEYDWGVRQKWRFESFCYGPKSCPFYKVGRIPMVPYKGLGSFPDDGGLDDILTENRDEDD